MARREKCNCGNCLCRVTEQVKNTVMESCGIRPPTCNGKPHVTLCGWCTYWTRRDGFQPFRHLAPPSTWTVAKQTRSGEVSHGI